MRWPVLLQRQYTLLRQAVQHHSLSWKQRSFPVEYHQKEPSIIKNNYIQFLLLVLRYVLASIDHVEKQTNKKTTNNNMTKKCSKSLRFNEWQNSKRCLNKFWLRWTLPVKLYHDKLSCRFSISVFFITISLCIYFILFIYFIYFAIISSWATTTADAN